jgi:hypothetical protein
LQILLIDGYDSIDARSFARTQPLAAAIPAGGAFLTVVARKRCLFGPTIAWVPDAAGEGFSAVGDLLQDG